ncbi:hypothetical protein K1719_021109 [Acacia pycnantha]|nr:hypothetical protein K1719_021109 [Acacia pycnantha]
MAYLFVLIILMATTNFTTSAMEATTQFKVGGDFGWRQPDPQNLAFYTHWAESNRFQIGDTLEFVYKNDSVLTVENWDYYNCDATYPITAFDNGKSIINLDRSDLDPSTSSAASTITVSKARD